ncbi:MAG: twin-arginine translocase TatA/TatE family subunit [Tissierellia bacterium]|nr:twin-arginine translocase TatA/TatE family subunit [Tissierellia bacterium]MDD4726429.1 twin-arginine translocase TatA/TatE family subunit [Tissierellia bacterium]
MGKLGMGELIVILVIALVIFGPSKLPEVGKSVGKAINEFKGALNTDDKDDTKNIKANDDSDDKKEA